VPGSAVYRRFRKVLRDAQVHQDNGAVSTFPSWFPVLRIDHVFHSADLTVHSALVPRTSLTRVASDHLPLLVEVSLP
jgi:endonuclease/exonuclease/phosphatase family metal-dependent hydrolase